MKNTSKKHHLLIWALTDNKPGHRNQIEGLIAALSQLHEVSVKWIVVESRVKGIFKRLLGKFSPSGSAKPDFLLAAGHRTHLHLLALKFSLGRPIVVMMKPSFPLSWFDVCLIPRHDQVANRPNVIETLGAINRVIPSNNKQKNTGLIMLGGPSKHYQWHDANVMQSIKKVLKQKPQIEWQVGSSRRTPDSLIVDMQTTFPNIQISTPDTVEKDWLPKQMQLAEHIWVTEDSVSMVYEAMTSGAQTGIILLNKNKQNRITEEMQKLLKEKRVASLESPLEHAMPPLNEAQRCAKILLSKMGY